MEKPSTLQQEIDERKSVYRKAIKGLQSARKKEKATSQKMGEIRSSLEKTDQEITQARGNLEKLTADWSSGDSSQAEVVEAQQAINHLEQLRLDNSRIFETLKVQAKDQKAIIEDLTRQAEKTERVLWQLAESTEIEKINQAAACMIKKAFLARQKWKGAWGFPKSMNEYIQHVFKDLALHEKERPSIEKELAAFFE